ncbi:UNVERIFIED_CONTAM: hypothetical protein K2H54_055368, partial [Gekko kuhli]
EVECLLQTFLEMDAGPRVMTSTHLETQGLFEDMAVAMRGQGYRRTGAQVRTKFKRVKGDFFDALEDWHGIPPPDPVVVVSSPEALPGEGQQPDPAAGAIQGIEERLRTMAAEMVNIRRTLNRHSYRLGFVQRGPGCSVEVTGRPMCLPTQGPGFVSRDAVPGGPLHGGLGSAACVAVAQLQGGGSKRLGEAGPVCGSGVAGGCMGIAQQIDSTVRTAGAPDPVEGVPACGGSLCRGCVAVALQLVANGEQVPVEGGPI